MHFFKTFLKVMRPQMKLKLLFSLQQKVRKKLKNNKVTFFSAFQRSLDLSFNPQSLNDTYWCFLGLFYFQSFFDPFLLLLVKKTKFIKFYSRLRVRRGTILGVSVLVSWYAANQYSHFTCVFSKTFKTMGVLKLNETTLNFM